MTTLYWTDEDTGDLTAITFDTTTSEEPVDTVTITDHPVEEGADVSDHVRKDPEAMTVEAYVTNTPHQGNVGPDDDHVVTTVSVKANTMGPPGTQTFKLVVPNPPIQISETGLIQAGVSAIGNAIFGGPNLNATAQSPATAQTSRVSAKAFASPTKRNRVRLAYDALLNAQAASALVTVIAEDREYFDMLIQRIARPRATGDGSAHKFQIDLRKLRIASSRTVESPKPAEARGAASVSSGTQATKPDPNATEKESILHGLTGDVSGQ